MNTRRSVTRSVSILLTLCLLIGMLPGTVYATVISNVSDSLISEFERIEAEPINYPDTEDETLTLSAITTSNTAIKLEDSAVSKIDLSEGYSSTDITRLLGLDVNQSNAERNAGFESSGLTLEEYEKAAEYHRSENILNRQLATLKTELKLENISEEDYDNLEMLICSGYTYLQARSAIVSAETLNLPLDFLKEAKRLSLVSYAKEDEVTEHSLDKRKLSNESVGVNLYAKELLSISKEDCEQYSELAVKLGIPENAVAYYMGSTKASTENTVLSQFQDAMELHYGAEDHSSSTLSSSDTPTVQYSPPHLLDKPYDYMNYGDLDVNMASGTFNYTETDLHIPGINGLDLKIDRIFNSAVAYIEVPYGISTGSYTTSNTLLVGQNLYVTYDFDNYEGFTLVSDAWNYYVEADEQYGDEYDQIFTVNTYAEAIEYYNALLTESAGCLYLVTDKDGDSAVAKMQPFIEGIGQFNNAFENGWTAYEYLIREFGLGDGWRLGFSAVERVYSITEDDVYWNLILSDGSMYRMEKNRQPQGLPSHLEFDWTDTTYTGSKYSLKHADGKIEYFDTNGRNIAIVDRYGNTIKLEYTLSGNSVTQIKITDTVGNIVLYKKDVIENPDEDGFGRVDGVTGSRGKYDTKWSLTLNGETIRSYYGEKEVEGFPDSIHELKIVEDENGQHTFYSTSYGMRDFNCFTTTPSTNDARIDIAKLGTITYPNGMKLEISMSVRNSEIEYERFGISGYRDVYPIGSINYSDTANSAMKHYFLYYGGDYSGFYNVVDDDYKFTTKTVDRRAVKPEGKTIFSVMPVSETEYTFNSEQELIKEVFTPYTAYQDEMVTAEGWDSPDRMTPHIVKTYSYNASHLPTNITTRTYEPVLATETSPSSYSESVQKYTYNSAGSILTDTAPNGMVTTYTYDATYQQPLSKTYKQDASITIVEQNTLTSDKKSVAQTIVTSNGTTKDKITYTYDSKGRMTSMNDYRSNDVYTALLYDYDGGAQITQVTTGGIKVEETSYNSRGWPTILTDANGEITTIEYDGTGQITKVIYPNGGVDNYLYDVANNTVTYTDPNNHTFIYTYDPYGNLLEVYDTTSQNALESYLYDCFNYKYLETIHSIDGTKDITTYYYHDHMGRPIETGIRNSDGSNTPLETYTYRANVRETTKETLGNTGAPTRTDITTVDKMGNVTQTGRKLAGAIYNDIYTYDYLGNQIESKSAYTTSRNGSYTTQNTFDHLGNILTSKDALGNTVSNTYDWNGNLLTSTDAKANVSTYTYDVLGRMLTATTPIDDTKSSIVEYVYDPVGNVIEQLSGKGTEVSNGLPTSFSSILYSYDEVGRLTSVEQPVDNSNSDVTYYTYDSAGNLLSSSVGHRKTNGTVSGTPSITSYTYDQFGNPLTMTDPLGNSETYTYDLNGNVLTKVDRNGVVTTYTYDNRGRLTNETIGTSEAAINRGRTYGLNGNLLTLSEGSNTISYVYDELGRLVSETDGTYTKGYTYNIGDLRTGLTVADVTATRISNIYSYDDLGRLSTVSGGGTTVSYAYDANGNLSNTTLGNGIAQSYTYNKANQIAQMTAQKDGTNISSYTYGYDLAGRRISTVDQSGTTTYTYDDLGRLTSEIGPDVSNSFTYDTRGNRATSTKNNVTTIYTYDLANRLLNSVTNGITTSYTYDDNGNTLTSKEGSNSAIQYSYNAANQQVGYTDSNNNITATYLYNPDGLRKAKTINGIATSYGWDGDDIVLESTVGTPTSYVRGLQLVSYNSGITAADASYYLHDGHGNVTYLTNNVGAVTDTYRYDAFGSQLNTTTAPNPFQYCGEYLDSENGNYYLRARNYVPELGRFLTENIHWNTYNRIWGDNKNGQPNIEAIRQSSNIYIYCMSDPNNYIDPDGELSFPGQIHNYVVKEVARKYSLNTEQTILYKAGWGRADLISNEGKVWDVKPDKTHHIEAGKMQVKKYVANKWKNHEEVKLSVGGTIKDGMFTVDTKIATYDISYRYERGGVIAYSYAEKIKWKEISETTENAMTVLLLAGSLYLTVQSGGALVPVLP